MSEGKLAKAMITSNTWMHDSHSISRFCESTCCKGSRPRSLVYSSTEKRWKDCVITSNLGYTDQDIAPVFAFHTLNSETTLHTRNSPRHPTLQKQSLLEVRLKERNGFIEWFPWHLFVTNGLFSTWCNTNININGWEDKWQSKNFRSLDKKSSDHGYLTLEPFHIWNLSPSNLLFIHT